MQFTRTNINKTFRNGVVNASNVAVTNVGGGGGSSSLSGNFLPAVNNGDGSYTVDLSKVVFTGNLIGEGEITAYGQGSTGGGSTSTGSVTIYDGLDSVATDAALSANQGRILRELIDNVGGGVTNWADLEGKPNWITDTKPSYSWSEIGSKPSTFTPSTHTHNYASTVKVGSTSYNISGNTISLPAYPTVPSALKNPNALTISLNGTSQGAYDGSAAKSFNITAASVGAAASSHSHSISNVSGLQDALNGKAASSHNHNSSYVSALGTNGNYLTWTKNGTTNNITVPYATAANKVTNTLTFTGYQSKSFNGSTAVSVAIPNNTNQLTNGAGFITSSASISGNAGSATKLQTARTIWGQSFNGTGNVSGSMTGVGAVSMSGNLTMAHSSTPTLTLKNNNSTDVQIILDRNVNASWKILNQSGTLYFQNNWVNGGKGSYFTALSIAYQTGHIVSKGNITSNGEITAYSDIRLKTDIQPLENRGYIKPVTYKKDGKDCIGFIAQEVRELYPELVIEDNTEDKYLSVNYAQYVAVLQAQIIDLKKEIDELKNIKTK